MSDSAEDVVKNFDANMMEVMLTLKDISRNLSDLTNYHTVKDTLSDNCSNTVTAKVAKIQNSIKRLEEDYTKLRQEIIDSSFRESIEDLRDKMDDLYERFTETGKDIQSVCEIVKDFDLEKLISSYATIQNIKLVIDNIDDAIILKAQAETAALTSRQQAWVAVKHTLLKLIIPVLSAGVAIVAMKMFDYFTK